MSRSYTPSHRGGRKFGTATITLVAAGAALVIGGVAGAVTLTGAGHGSAHPASSAPSHGWTAPGAAPAAPSYTAAANVTPPVAATDCTAPSTFAYTGTLSASAPGTVTYQWVYSSGRPGPVRTASFTAAGQQQVTGATVTAKTAGGGWGEIKVLGPVARTSDRAACKLLCGGSSAGGATVTAAVVGTPYSGGFGVTGQTSGLTVTWSVTGGSLPPGLSPDPGTGAITGTPAEQGSFTISVVATDVATGAAKQYDLVGISYVWG